jgi:hypothetical protein
MNAMKEIAMKHLITTCALALQLAAPAYAQSGTAAQADAAKPVPQGMMNCPMMADTGMQKDMGGMMFEMQAITNDTKDAATKERMQKIQDRMAVMMANMQKRMGGTGMMGNGTMSSGMMGGQQPGATPQAAPTTTPVPPDDNATHHPGQ